MRVASLAAALGVLMVALASSEVHAVDELYELNGDDSMELVEKMPEIGKEAESFLQEVAKVQARVEATARYEEEAVAQVVPTTEGWTWDHYTLYDQAADSAYASRKRAKCNQACTPNTTSTFVELMKSKAKRAEEEESELSDFLTEATQGRRLLADDEASVAEDSLASVGMLGAACDASAAPANGAAGGCTNSLADGATCKPTCDAGYYLSSDASCADGTLTAGVCALTSCDANVAVSNGAAGSTASGSTDCATKTGNDRLADGAECSHTCNTDYMIGEKGSCKKGVFTAGTCVQHNCDCTVYNANRRLEYPDLLTHSPIRCNGNINATHKCKVSPFKAATTGTALCERNNTAIPNDRAAECTKTAAGNAALATGAAVNCTLTGGQSLGSACAIIAGQSETFCELTSYIGGVTCALSSDKSQCATHTDSNGDDQPANWCTYTAAVPTAQIDAFSQCTTPNATCAGTSTGKCCTYVAAVHPGDTNVNKCQNAAGDATDATGALCTLNAAGDACAVATGACSFTAAASLTAATCTGTHSAGGTCALNTAVAATCQNDAGDAKDANGNNCALDATNKACAVTTGDCVYSAPVAAGTQCADEDSGCTFTPAGGTASGGARCIGTDADGGACTLNPHQFASCGPVEGITSGIDADGAACALNNNEDDCVVTSGACKFHSARAKYTTCTKMTGSCQYLAPGVELLPKVGTVPGEELPGQCNYIAGDDASNEDDGSPGIPDGIKVWTNGTGYKPTEVSVNVGNTDWTYLNFGPATTTGGNTDSNGLDRFSSDTNTSATSKRYFMHTFQGKVKLEKDVKYKFAIRSQDGADMWMTTTPGSTATKVLSKTGCGSSAACAGAKCTTAEFDEKTTGEITGDGYWRNIRIMIAKAKSQYAPAFMLRVMKETVTAGTFTTLNNNQLNVHHGEASCDATNGADSFCRELCSIAQTDNEWGTHANDFADADKRGKKKEGCRFYQRKCCSGDYIQFGPNQDTATANFAGDFINNIKSLVCTENYQAWLFDKSQAEMQSSNNANTLFVDGTIRDFSLTKDTNGVSTTRAVNDGIPCMKKVGWDGTNTDWSSKVKAMKVCEIDTDQTSTVAHRRRRGTINCRSPSDLSSGTSGQPEFSGWASIHYPTTGNVCDFGGGTDWTDDRKRTTASVALANATKYGSNGFTPGTGPAVAAGAAALSATDSKYATFDQDLVGYSPTAAVAASCTGNDSNGNACALNGDSSACTSTDDTCTFTAATSGIAEGYMHEWRGQIKLENNQEYKFAIASDDGATVWLEGATAPIGTDGKGNIVASWDGCHSITSTDSDLANHESVAITGDGKWHKIVIYYANYAESPYVAHMYLRVKKGTEYLTATEMGVRHNVGDQFN